MPYYNFYYRNFKLGQLYITPYGRIVKFIKVTPKGYNLLDIETNKCILRHHLYSRNFSGKTIPEDCKIIKNVTVHSGQWFKEIQHIKETFK